jgi:hypothetical protein
VSGDDKMNAEELEFKMLDKSQIQFELSAIGSRLEKGLKALEERVNAREQTIEDKIASIKAERIDIIDTKYKDKQQELTVEYEGLLESISSNSIDKYADESIAEQYKKVEYLNSVAVQLDLLRQALLKVSTQYFIDKAAVTRTFSAKRYLRELEKIDFYVREIDKTEGGGFFIAKLAASITKPLSYNMAYMLVSLLLGWLMVLLFPYYLARAVARAKLLHKYSVLYHKLMRTSVKLKNISSKDLETMLSQFLENKKNRLLEKLQDCEKRTEDIKNQIQQEKDSINIDRSQHEIEYDEAVLEMQSQIQGMRDRQEELDEKLKKVTSEIDELLKEQREVLARERDPYLNPTNTERNIELPEQIIYDFEDDKTRWFYVHPGVWVYNTRNLAESVSRSIIYQLRNYMKYGVIKFTVLDPLMGEFLRDMLLEEKSDITIEFARTGIDSKIDMLHDYLIRRVDTIKKSAESISDYNKIQDKIKSELICYEIVMIYLESKLTLSEQLLRLMKLGSKYGIHVMLFIQREILTIENLKVYEKHVDWIQEISRTGITAKVPLSFRLDFESATTKQVPLPKAPFR